MKTNYNLPEERLLSDVLNSFETLTGLADLSSAMFGRDKGLEYGREEMVGISSDFNRVRYDNPSLWMQFCNLVRKRREVLTLSIAWEEKDINSDYQITIGRR